jgi:Mn-dependent DtxR family transcriptional regulator
MLGQMILDRLKKCAATETELVQIFKTDVKKQIEELEHKGFVKKEANGKISLNSDL